MFKCSVESLFLKKVEDMLRAVCQVDSGDMPDTLGRVSVEVVDAIASSSDSQRISLLRLWRTCHFRPTTSFDFGPIVDISLMNVAVSAVHVNELSVRVDCRTGFRNRGSNSSCSAK